MFSKTIKIVSICAIALSSLATLSACKQEQSNSNKTLSTEQKIAEEHPSASQILESLTSKYKLEGQQKEWLDANKAWISEKTTELKKLTETLKNKGTEVVVNAMINQIKNYVPYVEDSIIKLKGKHYSEAERQQKHEQIIASLNLVASKSTAKINDLFKNEHTNVSALIPSLSIPEAINSFDYLNKLNIADVSSDLGLSQTEKAFALNSDINCNSGSATANLMISGVVIALLGTLWSDIGFGVVVAAVGFITVFIGLINIVWGFIC